MPHLNKTSVSRLPCHPGNALEATKTFESSFKSESKHLNYNWLNVPRFRRPA